MAKGLKIQFLNEKGKRSELFSVAKEVRNEGARAEHGSYKPAVKGLTCKLVAFSHIYNRLKEGVV